VARTPPDPDSGGHGTKTRHVFCQDSDPVGESGSLNVVYHRVEPKWSYFYTAVVEGWWIVARPKSGGKGRQGSSGFGRKYGVIT
jgi:hypothetical protein